MDLTRKYVAALRSSPALRDVSERLLRHLVHGGAPLRRAPGAPIYQQGEDPDGFYLVVTGEAYLYREDAGRRIFLGAVRAGACAGEIDALTGQPRPATLLADPAASEPIELLFFSGEGLAEQLATSAALQRMLQESEAGARAFGERIEAASPILRPGARSAEVVLLEGDPALGAPIAALTDLLAQTVTADFGDRTLIVRAIEAADDPAPQAEIGPDGVARATVSERQALDLRGAGAARLTLDRYDYVFLDLAGLTPAQRARVAEALASSGALHTRVALRGLRDRTRDLPGTLRTVIVTPGARGAAAEPHTEAPEDEAFLDTCRIHLDLGLLARGWSAAGGRTPLAEACARLDAARSATSGLPAREIFSHWGRALTQRQVGLALGGGGAWGFAHVALMRQMQRAKIPLDVVSGASIGAVIGGYHCARPIDGLARLLERTRALKRAVSRSWISSEAITRVVDEDLGGRPLAELPLCFFPVATDVLRGRRVVVTAGTVGFGVRASGAFPGLFTPTTVSGARYVDGGIIENVPVDVLSSRGVDLIIGSNVVPPPDRLAPTEPPISGVAGRFLHELNPIARAHDLVRSLFVLMHHVGNLEASGAHVIFNAGTTNYQFDPRRLELAPEIMASAEPAALEAVDRIKAAWDKLAARRRA